ncbi:hypothetical protein PGT21_006951 [Puccinia graminis f. sp. tritici]|uniref:Uncharacterized protein n=1 Tax=Puccinia graminis f. sp. tritici TaxID=56615 RepID=A0A5B0M0F7_PUCGR|nr:hypothetical protein PGT21_006951 [Puccinia graminis f. sp. tritici]
MINFRRFLAYSELPKNELKRLGKTRCRSRKPGVKNRVWIAEKGANSCKSLQD